MTNLIEFPLSAIATGTDRARDLDPAHAEALAELIRMQGLLCPVLVRPVGDGVRLVDGLHRLEAFRLLGREAIPAILSEAETDDAARLAELMANLGRKMTALDKCRHLYELKQVFDRQNPEVKRGGDRKSEKIKSQILAFDQDGKKPTAFDGVVAEQFNMGRSTVKEAVAIWEGLTKDSRWRLHGTVLATKKTELRALAALTAARQAAVLGLILEGRAGNVAQALELLSDGVAPSAEEKRFGQLSERFKALPDTDFDRLIAVHEARVIASLKRQGRL